jgi:hypothetical protein
VNCSRLSCWRARERVAGNRPGYHLRSRGRKDNLDTQVSGAAHDRMPVRHEREGFSPTGFICDARRTTDKHLNVTVSR